MPKQYYRADSFRASESIGYLMKRVKNLMTDIIEAAFERHGFNFTHWIVLMYLRDGLGNTTAGICREMHHDSGALTRVVDQLEQRGLINRQRSREDRRVVELELTRSGRETVEQLIPVVVDHLNGALDALSYDEIDQLKHLLQRVLTRLEAAVANGEVPGGKSK
jgi:DNA-binding MarR family transcriptional regulator